MSRITFLRPIDQPLGKRRLLVELTACLQSPNYSEFKFATGFAKVGPLARLAIPIRKWRESGKTVEGIFGIDRLGTSEQALNFALRELDSVYITRVSSSLRSTFHPRLCIFQGDSRAVGFYGSHNLTVGGTETNFEGGVKVEFDRSVKSDEASFQQLLECWTSLLPESCSVTQKLTAALLDEYLRDGLLCDETQRTKGGKSSSSPTQSTKSEGSSFVLVPPSSLPKEILAEMMGKRGAKTKSIRRKEVLQPLVSDLPSIALVIQIVPHHNGEIFLSKSAVNQNPTFFEFPFSGRTVPKKSSNKSYPQRIPDPLVHIKLYDSKGKPLSKLERINFPLNMVYYEAKSEIRITVNPQLARKIPSHSVLVMSRPDEPNPHNYTLDIYLPGSRQFENYLSVCNQTLPSGGSYKARKVGWL